LGHGGEPSQIQSDPVSGPYGIQRGGITKTGNSHLRRVIVEAAWAYQHKPWIGGWLAKRQQGLDEETKAVAWKAQWRLCTRYKKLAARGKNKNQIVTAIGRELLGFIWAIAVRTERGLLPRRLTPEAIMQTWGFCTYKACPWGHCCGVTT
jgi:hypothetical protein